MNEKKIHAGCVMYYCSIYCEQYSYELEHCKHEEFEFAKKETTARKQCLKCSALFGNFVSTKTVDFVNIKDYKSLQKIKGFENHESLEDSYVSKYKKKHCKKYGLFENKIETTIRNKKHKEYYHAYLKSDLWKNKRETILQRDKYTCQGCLIKKASEVHHLDYARVGKELAIDLISLCRECHKKIHSENLYKPYENFIEYIKTKI
jgi:hypothetical protein